MQVNKHVDQYRPLEWSSRLLPEILLLHVWLCSSLAAQTAPAIVAATLTPFDQRVFVAAQGGLTSVPVVLDPTASGGDTLDIVTSDPSVVVTLVTPTQVSINTQNAASFGLTWRRAPWVANSFSVPTFLDTPGRTLWFNFLLGCRRGHITSS
jgi:hypothetical protein